MNALRLVRLAIAAAALGSGLAAARAPAPPPIAVLGLRPTEDAALGATALARLSEAQLLRKRVESLVEVASAGQVLGHEQLRASLGRAYLVAVFDCRGEATCQVAVARPLRALGVVTAVVGDYHAGPDRLRVRLRTLDLVRERVADESIFEVPRDDGGAVAPWRAGLAPLFGETGSIRLVVSQPDAACLLDGRPCQLDPAGVLEDVPEGEHLLVVTREGFKRAERVVAVRRREEVRVAVALEPLPVQAQRAPDPENRVPVFEKPTGEPQAKLFGSLRLALAVDDVNAGDREDPFVPAGATHGPATFTALPRPAVLGAAVQAPSREDGWQLRGAISLAWVKDAGPEIDSAYAELVHEERGLRLLMGWGPSIVSGLTPGTLTLAEAFGDLSYGGVGLTGSTSVGPVLLEAFLGKQKAQFSPEAALGGAATLPALALHAAYVAKGDVGTLYGEAYPLTVGLSALAGVERAGVGDEAAWAAGAGLPVVVEQVPYWVASLEAFVPFGGTLSLAGEAWVGDDVRLLEGAAWQPPRLDPATGRHRALRSAGGWVQAAWTPEEALEVRLVAGTDRAVDRLTWGRPAGDEPAIAANTLIAVAGLRRFGQLLLGAQVHAVRTSYGDPALPSVWLRALTLSAQLKF
jgi:hypothetical protein